MFEFWGGDLVTNQHIKFVAMWLMGLQCTILSCASNKYTIKPKHDLRFVPIRDGQNGEPVQGTANNEVALAPGLWLVTSTGYESAYLYIPAEGAKSSTIHLTKSGDPNPRRLVREIFEIQSLIRRKNNNEALEKLRQLRVLFPDVSDLALLQVSIMIVTGDTAGAQKLLKDIIKANPDNVEAQNLLKRLSEGGANQ
jgi:hypothetical protein